MWVEKSIALLNLIITLHRKNKTKQFNPMEKRETNRNILSVVREILGKKSPAIEKDGGINPSPDDGVVERLISKAVDETPGKNPDKEPGIPASCPYATKRAIVESLAAIRKFARDNNLASTVLKAILTLLAEIALDAVKGKVGTKALETLLKAFNYDSAKKEAFKKGETAGRNARIKEEIFPPQTTGLPDINGSLQRSNRTSNIFRIAEGDE